MTTDPRLDPLALRPSATDGDFMQTMGGVVTWGGVDIAAEAERIRDVVAAALAGGAGVSIVVDDTGDTITISIVASTALVPMVSQVGTGDPDFVWTDDGELLMVEVPL